MRFFVLIALCLAVASASYVNKNRFNRLLRNLQQQQGQGYESHDLYSQEYDDQDDDQCQGQDQDDEDQYSGQQCPRRRGGLNFQDEDDDQEYEYGNGGQDDEDQDQDSEYGQDQGQRQRQRRNQQYRQQEPGPQQQQKRRQQQKHQCQPKFQLLQALEHPNCKLASKLYKQAKQQNDDKNTVVSPAAVQLALAAIQRGARGNTKRQIQRLIGSRLSQQQQQQAHAALRQVLQGQNGQQQQQQSGQGQQGKLRTTTTIVVNQQCQPQQKFIQAVKACLNAQVKKCNFQRQPQQCRQQINQYVSQKTQHKLPQVVPQDAITTNTKMIVVNTAQLKARWGQQFRQQQQTKQGRFYPLGCQQPKPVQVLQSQGQFSYHEDQQLQVVGIPTQRQELTLYVIVPKSKDGLNEIEKQQIQNGQQLKQLLEQADQQRQQVDIELPKFQIKHKIDAKQTLEKQGVQDLCDADQADLSGICGQQGRQGRRQQQDQSDETDDYEQDEQGQQGRQGRRQRQQYGDNDEEYQQQGQYDQDEPREQQLHLNKLIHQATIKVDEQGISAARPGRQQQQYQQDQDQDQDQDQEQEQYQQQGDQDDEDQQDQYEQRQYSRQDLEENIFGQRRGQRQHQSRQQRGQQGGRKVKVNRAFAFVVKHNPSNQIVMVGRVVDATQKPKQQQGGRQQGQSLNGIDQQ